MDYILIRSKRKTLAIYVKPDGIEVRAPQRMPKTEIDRFIAQKRGWAKTKLAALAARIDQKATFTVNYGSRVPYGGREWIVGGVPGRKAFFDNAFCVPVYLTPQQVKQAVIKIYHVLARRDLTEKVQQYAEIMNAQPNGIKINGAKTRWGSCSAKKSLNFSWRLMMAADDVIDYVVVHELAHIKEMNHSPSFWSVVGNLLPDYRQRQARLKALQKRLDYEDWD